MDALVVVLVIVAVLAVVAVVIGLTKRKQARQRPAATAEPVDPFADSDHQAVYGDPRKLKAGDLVDVRGLPFMVRGSLRLDEGGWTWSEHLLEQADGTRLWLGVEEDPDLVLTVWTEAEGDLRPGAGTLTHDGKRFRSDEKGKAKFRSEATTGLNPEGTVRYHDYESADGALLSFESYGDADWEMATGEQLTAYDLKIYPAGA